MPIWTSERVLAGLALLALAACSDGGDGAFFGDGGASSRPNTALIRADMARGAIALVPPDGFCIDRRGLRQDFAVLARCDTLGGRGGGQGAPLGIIAVSVTASPEPFTLTDVQSLAGPGAATLSTQTAGAARIVHLTGPTPRGTDARHWKAVMPLGGYALAMSAFGPQGGPLAASDGGRLLASLAARTQAASAQADVAETPPAQAGLGGLLSGLFD